MFNAHLNAAEGQVLIQTRHPIREWENYKNQIICPATEQIQN